MFGNYETEECRREYNYIGEIYYDSSFSVDTAYGYGVATDPNTGFTMTGNFKNSRASGVMILESKGKTEI